MIQQAIVQVLSPVFDPAFSEFSDGFRPGHSQHQAVRQIKDYVWGGKRTAVDVNLSTYFERVNHDLLMTQLGKTIRDKSLLTLIYNYLRTGIVEYAVLIDWGECVPQSGPLSPPLSDIALDPLGKELKKRGHKSVRRADDFILLDNSKRAGNHVLKCVTRFFRNKLTLNVNNQRRHVVSTSKSKFLGFTFHSNQISWHADSERKLKREIKILTGSFARKSMKAFAQEHTVCMRGWIKYFGINHGFQKCRDFDSWIRRRLRMCYWKHW